MSGLNALLSKPLRGLLFDLDGTLVDSVPDLAAALDTALESLGYPPAGEARARHWVGNGAPKLAQRGLAWALQVDEVRAPAAQVERLLAEFYRAYGEDSWSRSQLYPGVREALEYWAAQGIKMACVTNKPERFTHPLLAHFGMDALLPVVVGGDTLPQRKPDPAPLLLACERLGVSVGSTVMVGDSINDVQAARACHMPVACVSYGYNHGSPIADAKPDLLVAHFSELPHTEHRNPGK